jgi:epoxyqueuosine reductase
VSSSDPNRTSTKEASSRAWSRAIRDEARRLGFDHIGIARARELEPEHSRYVSFVASGKAGAMKYLERVDERRRLDIPVILEGAESVVSIAAPYARDDENDPDLARLVARYARGRDYHNHVKKRVRKLARFIRTLSPDANARGLADVEPILERPWAARGGLGFVGKHGLIIVPGVGSFLLLGEVVTNLVLEPGEPIAERCGSCRLCLDACPTQAFDAPFVLDPRRCISYFTVENEGDVPDVFRDRAERWLFGCDDCQTACPYNRTSHPKAQLTEPFRPLSLWADLKLRDLVSLTEERFFKLFEGSPVKRGGRVGLARGAIRIAEARAKRGDHGARAVIETALNHDDARVVSDAQKARSRLETTY